MERGGENAYSHFFHERIRRRVAGRARLLATNHKLDLLSANDLRELERDFLYQQDEFRTPTSWLELGAPSKISCEINSGIVDVPDCK